MGFNRSEGIECVALCGQNCIKEMGNVAVWSGQPHFLCAFAGDCRDEVVKICALFRCYML